MDFIEQKIDYGIFFVRSMRKKLLNVDTGIIFPWL